MIAIIETKYIHGGDACDYQQMRERETEGEGFLNYEFCFIDRVVEIPHFSMVSGSCIGFGHPQTQK